MRISTSLLALAAIVAAAVAEANAVPRANKLSPPPKAAAKPKQLSQTEQFCQKFTAECYNQALHGKTGKITVVHSCKRNGNSFSFGCKAGTKTLTKQVLAELDDGSVSYITSASTETVPTTSTATTTTVTTTGTLTTATVSFTAQETTTTTSYVLSEQPVPVGEYVITAEQALQRRVVKKTTNTSKPAGKVDDSSFCRAYTAACERQCKRRYSTPKVEVCQLKSIAGYKYKYNLSCYCKNGWTETQHALADLDGSVSIATVSTIGTKYSTVTATSTVTSTATSTSTITTSSAVATVTTTSTTQVVLAPTGSLKALDRNSGINAGYITLNPGNPSQWGVLTSTTPNSWMATLDATSGLYALQLTDGSGFYFGAEVGFSGGDWNRNPSGYAWSGLELTAAPAGPASGNGPLIGDPYQSYVFSPVFNTTTTLSLQLDAAWFNNDGTRSAMPIWAYVSAYEELLLVNDVTSVQNNYQVTLRALTLYLEP